jgi:RND family efflux transporter MFP subunit
MSRRGWVGVAVALAVAAIGIWWYVGRGSEPATATAARGSIDVTIQTIGTLQAADPVSARSGEAGAVAQLGAAEGDQVQQGDILALLDRAPFERALADAQRRLTDAEFALQAAERNAEGKPDDDQSRLDARNASESVDAAQRALDDAQLALNNSAILAPADGTVLQLAVKVGDAVADEQLVATLGRAGAFEIVADVDELDLPNVAPGAEARFRLDAFPANEIEGVVSSTAPQARQQGGATVFATSITFNAPDGLDLRPGMNADVTIVTAERQNVLLIPQSALKTVGERSFVTVVDGGKQSEREVTLGYRGNGQVEVVAGLSEGERVLLR